MPPVQSCCMHPHTTHAATLASTLPALGACRIFPYFDPRLPLRPDQPDLEFAVQQQEITSTQQWQQVSCVLA